jgi:acyl dehydratase
MQQMQALVGQSFRSDWIVIDQPMIDAFAAVTGDHQFIHVDPTAAAASPFGTTIAHGFLILSLLPRFAASAAIPQPTGIAMEINYGCNNLRFVSPVRSGTSVRAVFTLRDVIEKRPGQYQRVTEFVVEIAESDRPALVAEWISQLFAHP